jgi:hypothetical protein
VDGDVGGVTNKEEEEEEDDSLFISNLMVPLEADMVVVDCNKSARR